jgi:predicted TIM-barrel fold metal-dependent hydrolase
MAVRRSAGQVTVGGHRVRTIDIDADVIIPEATAPDGREDAPDNASVISPDLVHERFATMDEWGTDMQALSINANWYGVDRDVAQKMIQLQNEKLAELVARYPGRFIALASVVLQFPEMAAGQLEQGVKKYNQRGAAIWRSRQRRRTLQSQVRPVLEEGRGTGMRGLHASTGHSGNEQKTGGRRRSDERDRQSARDYDSPLASEFRRDVRPVPRPEDLRGVRRRVPAVQCSPLRLRLQPIP